MINNIIEIIFISFNRGFTSMIQQAYQLSGSVRHRAKNGWYAPAKITIIFLFLWSRLFF